MGVAGVRQDHGGRDAGRPARLAGGGRRRLPLRRQRGQDASRHAADRRRSDAVAAEHPRLDLRGRDADRGRRPARRCAGPTATCCARPTPGSASCTCTVTRELLAKRMGTRKDHFMPLTPAGLPARHLGAAAAGRGRRRVSIGRHAGGDRRRALGPWPGTTSRYGLHLSTSQIARLSVGRLREWSVPFFHAREVADSSPVAPRFARGAERRRSRPCRRAGWPCSSPPIRRISTSSPSGAGPGGTCGPDRDSSSSSTGRTRGRPMQARESTAGDVRAQQRGARTAGLWS